MGSTVVKNKKLLLINSFYLKREKGSYKINVKKLSYFLPLCIGINARGPKEIQLGFLYNFIQPIAQKASYPLVKHTLLDSTDQDQTKYHFGHHGQEY